MSGPVQPPLTVETIDGATVGRPITKIKVTNGTLAVSGSTATLTISGGGGGSGTVTSIATTAPLTGGTITTTGTIGIPVATGAADGYLSSANFNTFDAKQDAITLTTTGTSGAATFSGGTLNIPQYSGTTGTVTGTGAANQVSYWTAASVQAGSTGLTYDPSTGDLTVGGYVEVGTKITTPTGTDLTLDTVNGTDSGSIIIADGVDGQVSISANGSGAIKLGAANNPVTVSNVYTLPTAVTTDNGFVLTAQTDGSTAWAAGGGSVSFPLNGPDDSASAPNYSWTNASTSGLFRLTSSTVGISAGASAAMYFQSDKVEANQKFEVLAGSAAVPSLMFAGDNDTGLYLDTTSGSNGVGITKDGVQFASFGYLGGIEIKKPITASAGSVSAPAYGFSNDGKDNGFYRAAVDTIAIANNGAESFRFAEAGQLGVQGANYGTTGQVLTSAGPSSPPTWSTAGGSGLDTTPNIFKANPPTSGSDLLQYPLFAQFGTADTTSNKVVLFNTTSAVLVPFFAPKTGDIQKITCKVSTASDDDVLVSVYNSDGDNLPQTRIGSEVTWPMDLTGEITLDVSSITDTWDITAGELYYIAMMMKSTAGGGSQPYFYVYEAGDGGAHNHNIPTNTGTTAKYQPGNQRFNLSSLSAALPTSITTSNLSGAGGVFNTVPVIGVAM